MVDVVLYITRPTRILDRERYKERINRGVILRKLGKLGVFSYITILRGLYRESG